MKVFYFIQLLFIFFIGQYNCYQISTSKSIPNFIKVCHRNDPNLNACVKASIEQLRPKLIEGIPELSLPPCDPLSIPKVTISQSQGAITLNSEYTNIKVYGLSKFHLKKVKIDPTKDRFQLRLWFDKLQMTSQYNINGRLLMLPLHGKGRSQGNYSDVDVTASMKTERFNRNDKEYLKVKEMIVDFNIGEAKFRLNDLFNGNTELGEMMNKFINDNWRILVAELRPALEEALSNIIINLADKVFQVYSADTLFPE